MESFMCDVACAKSVLLGELLANNIQSYNVFNLDHVSVEKVTTSASIPKKLLSKD